MRVDHTVTELDKTYNSWIRKNRLPLMSADELLCEVDSNDEYITTPKQRKWLKNFIDQYENA
jgi:hypothetical protein